MNVERFVDFLGLDPNNIEFYDRLADQLIDHEGYREEIYYDHLGNPTIGVGHHLDGPLSETAIGLLLLEDIARAEADLDSVLPNWREFEEARRLALLDMCFNMGKPRFLTFKKMLAALDERDWERAAKEMLDSKWRRQVGRRAIRLAEMMRRGDEGRRVPVI